METNLLQRAKDAINNLMSMPDRANDHDKQATQEAIQAAYENASPEEQQQLQQLEQQLKSNNHLDG